MDAMVEGLGLIVDPFNIGLIFVGVLVGVTVGLTIHQRRAATP